MLSIVFLKVFWFFSDTLFPMGQIPVLQLECGTVICESHAVFRHLGREFDLYGKTNKDKVVIDQTLDVLKGLEEKLWKNFFFAKGEERAEGIKAAYEQVGPRALKMVEGFLQSNKGGKGFLVGDSVSQYC
jgi:glutathione S-transferase